MQVFKQVSVAITSEKWHLFVLFLEDIHNIHVIHFIELKAFSHRVHLYKM